MEEKKSNSNKTAIIIACICGGLLLLFIIFFFALPMLFVAYTGKRVVKQSDQIKQDIEEHKKKIEEKIEKFNEEDEDISSSKSMPSVDNKKKSDPEKSKYKAMCKSNTELESKIVGTYEYKGEYVDNVPDDPSDDAWATGKMAYENLTLNADKTANAKAGNMNAGGYNASGNWCVSDNKLLLFNDDCELVTLEDGSKDYPNCSPVWVYEYSLDGAKVTLTSDNNSGTTVTLSKTN